MNDAFNIDGTVTYVMSHGKCGGSIFIMEPFNSAFGTETKIVVNKNIQTAIPLVGEVWNVNGSYDDDDMYGEQIIAHEAYPTIPSGKVIVDFLSNNERFVGIGHKTAKALWGKFGEELYDILGKSDSSRLVGSVRNLSAFVVDNLIEAWQEYAELIAAIRFFNKLNLNARVARKSIEFWGEHAIDKVKEDPYRLLAFSNWKKVDRIALGMFDVGLDSKIRLVAAVEAALYEAYDDQHTCQRHDALKGKLESMLGDSGMPDMAIKEALSDGRVVKFEKESGDWVYQNTGIYAVESFIASRVHDIQCGERHQPSLFAREYSDERLSEYESTLPFPLATEQREAIKMVATNSFGIIVGGAGVGKTTVLQGVYHMLPDHAVIMQAALTNRAASRMKESTGIDALTISKLVHTASEEGLPDNLYLFIDEASMLDVPMFYRILRALPKGTRLYLVGDHHQLPPIGPGLILHRFVQDEYEQITKLVQVHRQANETGIPQVSNAIRNMTVPALQYFISGSSKGIGVSILPCSKDNLATEILSVYRELNTSGEVQVVAARNATCETINTTLHNENLALREYHKLSTSIVYGYDNVSICEDDKVVYRNNNDSKRELYNGSTGVITRIYDNPVIALDDDENQTIYVAEAVFDSCGFIELTEDDMEFVDLGYAITVHKAQGSQWERVVVASEYVSKTSPIVDNTWFYTAITRCQEQAVIVGNMTNFEYQVSKPPRSFSRNVGLSFKKPLKQIAQAEARLPQ